MPTGHVTNLVGPPLQRPLATVSLLSPKYHIHSLMCLNRQFVMTRCTYRPIASVRQFLANSMSLNLKINCQKLPDTGNRKKLEFFQYKTIGGKMQSHSCSLCLSNLPLLGHETPCIKSSSNADMTKTFSNKYQKHIWCMRKTRTCGVATLDDS